MRTSGAASERGGDLAGRLRSAQRVTVLTGAGVSAESGVPTFRGKDGLWRDRRVHELATPRALLEEPDLAWEWYHWRRGLVNLAAPNSAHYALARIQDEVPSFCLLTQNVDGLHSRAGSRNVVELHGNIHRARCEGCGCVVPLAGEQGVPRCSTCGSAMRPDVVLFGESLDEGVVRTAVSAAAECDVFLVVGTSGVVYPAAALPGIARESGAFVAVVNAEPTPLSEVADESFVGLCGEVLPALVAQAWGP